VSLAASEELGSDLKERKEVQRPAYVRGTGAASQPLEPVGCFPNSNEYFSWQIEGHAISRAGEGQEKIRGWQVEQVVHNVAFVHFLYSILPELQAASCIWSVDYGGKQSTAASVRNARIHGQNETVENMHINSPKATLLKHP
jgi:hypothetical protein